MSIKDTSFKDVKIISWNQREDDRGTMSVTFDEKELKSAGIDFVCKEQRIYSMPQRGTFFGIHYQCKSRPQDKIIHLIAGRGVDYIIDLRKTSKTYKKWIAIELTGEDDQSIYIPQGYGHAFLSLEDNTIQLFMMNESFYKGESKQIHYQDPQIQLKLPIDIACISDKDKNAPFLDDEEVGA